MTIPLVTIADPYRLLKACPMKLSLPFFKKKNRPAEPDWLKMLNTGDIAIDCGANVGKITQMMAERGATVYAFEPNPHAFAELQKNTASYKNVHCFQQAVGTEPGMIRLYMHENAHENPVYWSTGSSVLAFKGNVNQESFVEVECIDLCEFIQNLNQPVRVLKMDVEGVECPIIKKLIYSDLIHNIGQLLCEMHDKKIPQIRTEAEEVRNLIAERQLTHVDLDWI